MLALGARASLVSRLGRDRGFSGTIRDGLCGGSRGFCCCFLLGRRRGFLGSSLLRSGFLSSGSLLRSGSLLGSGLFSRSLLFFRDSSGSGLFLRSSSSSSRRLPLSSGLDSFGSSSRLLRGR